MVDVRVGKLEENDIFLLWNISDICRDTAV